ncbi:hypothetical protein B1B04_18775 [Lysinibacillus sp. KCTC 33748]|uniref:hypothetical protein n=1 Tax=unclassified Lysinibacillus TaxID=2636778 RepID=UPI0009A5734D|nr:MULTISPECIES: hypothetical protein [unclassified Lysinibacillus]OXS70209.1 hypothetical protein B1B04_18775 [Lysinibacillus sp. KCTC 33748]SKC04671.1 hypothetical protein SAMN06295926_11943 [Lysinibacillus sp. AC-3]
MNLLINEPPLQVLPTLAAEIGLNNAIVLQQVHYWLRVSTNNRDGHKWVYKTIDEWHEEFPFWSKRTLERVIQSLEDLEILVAGNYNKLKMDRTKWYRIKYETLCKLHENASRQNDGMQPDKMTESKSPNCQEGNRQNDVNVPDKMAVPITREYTETTTETTQRKGNSRKRVYDESSVHYQLANRLYQKILIDDPSFKQPNMNTWADSIRLMMEQDNRTVEQIEYLIDWSQENQFWKSNILSTKKLREKATTLIRQIKADKAKENNVNSPSNFRRQGRTEVVPEWFNNRNEEKENAKETTVEIGQEIDFEAERQKILKKLGSAKENAK